MNIIEAGQYAEGISEQRVTESGDVSPQWGRNREEVGGPEGSYEGLTGWILSNLGLGSLS